MKEKEDEKSVVDESGHQQERDNFPEFTLMSCIEDEKFESRSSVQKELGSSNFVPLSYFPA